MLSELAMGDDFTLSDGRSAQSVLEELLAWEGNDSVGKKAEASAYEE